MKKIVGLISFSFLLFVGETQQASADLVSKTKNYVLNKALGYGVKAENALNNGINKEEKYLKSKNYADLQSSAARLAVPLFCTKGCGSHTCGKVGKRKSYDRKLCMRVQAASLMS